LPIPDHLTSPSHPVLTKHSSTRTNETVSPCLHGLELGGGGAGLAGEEGGALLALEGKERIQGVDEEDRGGGGHVPAATRALGLEVGSGVPCHSEVAVDEGRDVGTIGGGHGHSDGHTEDGGGKEGEEEGGAGGGQATLLAPA